MATMADPHPEEGEGGGKVVGEASHGSRRGIGHAQIQVATMSTFRFEESAIAVILRAPQVRGVEGEDPREVVEAVAGPMPVEGEGDRAVLQACLDPTTGPVRCAAM